ncbi:MAG: hypothetical protein IJW29_06560 [Clostridia bacterium]|nr:hypothetical protein [Clostridia bacterium]
MSKETVKRIHLIYGIVLSVLIVAVGICLIASCIDIYNSGEQAFSRESVAAHFQKIAILVYICLGALVGGIILSIVLPLEKTAVKGKIDPKLTLSRLSRKLDTEACGEKCREMIAKQHKFRAIVKSVASVLCVACAVPVVLYLFDPYNLGTENLNHDVFSAMLFTVCFFLDTVIICFAAGKLLELSIDTETRIVKAALAKGYALKQPREDSEEEKRWKTWGIHLTRIFAIAASMLGAALFVGSVMYLNGFSTAAKMGAFTFVAASAVVLILLVLALYFGIWREKKDFNCEKSAILAARVAILALAILFIVLGVRNGGMRDVLQKAIRICTECIGLG